MLLFLFLQKDFLEPIFINFRLIFKNYLFLNLELYLELLSGYTDEMIMTNKENKYTTFIKLKND